MKIRWWRDRHTRVAHSKRRIAEQEHLNERLEAQQPKVLELAAFARRQLARNHLSQLFDNIVDEGRRQ